MSDEKLTPNSFKAFIRDYTERHGEAPGTAEIASEFGLSFGGVLNFMAKEGLSGSHNGQTEMLPEEMQAQVESPTSDEPQYSFDPGRTGSEYEFLLDGGAKTVWLSKESMDYICQAYSRETGGLNKTKKTISDEINISLSNLEGVLKAYEFQKGSPPHTHERLMEAAQNGTMGELTDETIQMVTQRYRADLARKERTDLTKLVNETQRQLADRKKLYRDILDAEYEVLQDFEANPPRTYSDDHLFNVVKGDEWVSYHAPVADLHMGSEVYGKELWGNNYDVKIASQRILDHGIAVAKKIGSAPYRCHTLYLTDVGDFFHGLRGETVHGTKLHQDTRPKKTYLEAYKAKIKQIEAVRGVADKVVLKQCEGNHDGDDHWTLFHALSIFYEDQPDVEIEITERPQAYFIEGSTAHILDHGYKMSAPDSPAAKVKAELAARKILREDYPKASRIIYYVGHLHSYATGESGDHLEIIRLPSFGETDDYAQMLYFHNNPRAFLYRLDDHGRLAGDERIYFHNLNHTRGTSSPTPAGA